MMEKEIILEEQTKETNLNLLSENSVENSIFITEEKNGGSSDYKSLFNKPKINGIELVGNKSLDELGIKQEYTASDIKFEDGDTFQDKYNSGELKGETGLQGVSGKDGKTPVKGTDYYTEDDKQEMVELVLAALPSSEEVSY